ncbi:MAG TPA: hypothetical protein VNA89_09455 [Gemmatimonadaceae bacterium]|nr:hypothetical protein [Gemmatimonadaceae bacterium]
MKRLMLAACTVLVAAAAGRLEAQEDTIRAPGENQTYSSRREELVRELQRTQQQLNEVRGQRVQLQSRVEQLVASMMEQRAQMFLLSNEQNALQQLDAILTSAQDNLLAQRDRFLAVSDAVTRRTGAMLVVLLRADSSAATQTLESAQLSVDNGAAEARTYSSAANDALRLGAVDQLLRSTVLPTAHTVTLTATVNGQPVTQTVSVNAQGESITYVQFAVRNGQLVPTTWTTRSTTPF